MLDTITIVGHINPSARTETMVDEYFDNEVISSIYANFTGPRVDHGGGISSISAYEVIGYFDNSPHKLNREIKIGLKQARAFLEWANKMIREEEIY